MKFLVIVMAISLANCGGINLPPLPWPTPTPIPTPTPTPTPEPTPVPTPTPEPTPPPVVTCGNENDLEATGGSQDAEARAALERAKQQLGNPIGRPPQETLARLSTQLNANGVCTVLGIEAVFIKRADGLYDEYHAVAFTDGGWTQNPFRVVLKKVGDTVPTPTPPPTACSDVPPLQLFVVHRRDIREGWEWFDSTPHAGDFAYCQSIGFNRAPCPAGQEGDPERLRRERCMLGGPAPKWVWTGTSQDGYLREGSNGFGFEHRKVSSGSLKVCNADETVCTTVIGG